MSIYATLFDMEKNVDVEFSNGSTEKVKIMLYAQRPALSKENLMVEICSVDRRRKEDMVIIPFSLLKEFIKKTEEKLK